MATIPVVNIMDKRKGIASAIIVLILLLLYLLLVTIEMADPKPEPMITPVETEFPEELILENLRVEGGMDAGNPNNDEVKPPEPTVEEIVTQTNSDTQAATGQGATTNSNQTENTASNTQVVDDPFASGGQNGGTGSGSTFGDSPNPGPGGNGTGGGIKRILVTQPSFGNISTENANISLKVTIDANGNVIAASCNQALTTTTNQTLINKVIAQVKKHAKYNKDPGSTLVKVILTITVEAS